MKKTSFFSFLLLINYAHSQTYRFFYELLITKPANTVIINMVLDIDKKNTKFYDKDFLIIDSLNRYSAIKSQINSESDQLISRKTNTAENLQYHTHTYDYFVVKSNDRLNWNLEMETKKIGNIKLQKATTNFGGRKWIAWFDPKIPFQEGPYKFNGLSGLIYEVYDTENIFHYSLIKSINLPEIYNTDSFLETHYGKKPILVSLQQFQKVKLDYYNNIVEVLKEFSKKGGSIASDQDITTPEQIQKRRKELQQSIKKYYLPLERDKSIPYPNN